MQKEKFTCLNLEYQQRKIWCVFEYATEQVVAYYDSERDANKYKNFLESGGAFAGFTPRFMAQT